MTYRKPPNVRYVDMCIYIDQNIYKEDRDDNLIFEYLYHLCVMFAHKANYFKNKHYLDDFGIFAATYVYMRLVNKRQFFDEDNPKKLKPIKSVLNYIKRIIYPIKVQFEQSNYYQGVNYEKEELVADFTLYTYKDQIQETLDKLNKVEFCLYLEQIPSVLKEFLNSIPHIKNSNEWLNIYTSCLLSLLNSITMSNINKKRLTRESTSIRDSVSMHERIYKDEQRNNIILYHLNESYRPYISVLLNKLRHIIASNLSSNLYTYIPSGATFVNVMSSEVDSYDD